MTASGAKGVIDGAKAEIIETEKTIEAAKKIFEHTNAAQGHLQMYQAQNELKTSNRLTLIQDSRR